MVELEHKAMWPIKKLNIDLDEAGQHRKLQIDELDEIRNETYENAKIYKEWIKIFHDQAILKKLFLPDQKVLLYNSRLYLFSEKLKSRWTSPFIVKEVFSYGVIEIENLSTDAILKIDGQRLKPFLELPTEVVEEAMVLHEPIYID